MTDQEHFDWVWTKWNEHVSKRGLPTDLEYPCGEIPITQYLERGARDHPERPAVNFYGRDVSYRELDEWRNRFANFLIDKGYGRGDYIAIHLYNCPQYLVAHFGGMKAGCTIVPLDPVWKEIELETPIEDIGPSLIVTQDINFPVVEKLREKHAFEYILTSGRRDRCANIRRFPRPLSSASAHPLQRWRILPQGGVPGRTKSEGSGTSLQA